MSEENQPIDEETKSVLEPEKIKKHQEDSGILGFVQEVVKVALIATILAYVIRIFIIQPFVVEGSSMFPILHDKDYLLVDKVSYRLHEPARGDVIVFKFPKNTEVNYVKRIIGLPGEKVEIVNGDVSIINKEHPSGIKLDESYTNDLDSTFVNGSNSANITSEFVVPAGEYFVMGDNRLHSSDSREWSYLPKEMITGKVDVRVFPIDRISTIKHAKFE